MPTSSTGTVERTPCVPLLTVNSNTPHLVYCTMCGLHFASFHSDTLKLCRFREIGNGCWSRHLRLYKTHHFHVYHINFFTTYISRTKIFSPHRQRPSFPVPKLTYQYGKIFPYPMSFANSAPCFVRLWFLPFTSSCSLPIFLTFGTVA